MAREKGARNFFSSADAELSARGAYFERVSEKNGRNFLQQRGNCARLPRDGDFERKYQFLFVFNRVRRVY